METYRGPTVRVKKPKVRFRKKDGRIFIVVNGRWIGMSIPWQNGIPASIRPNPELPQLKRNRLLDIAAIVIVGVSASGLAAQLGVSMALLDLSIVAVLVMAAILWSRRG